MNGIWKDLVLARTARRMVRANGPNDRTAATSVEAMLNTPLTALEVGLSDQNHPTAVAIAQVVGKYQDRINAIEWRAWRIANPQAATRVRP